MDYRHLGRSGLMVSAMTYGNWFTYASQISEDAARACLRAALDIGITTFDTADMYAGGAAESLLGKLLEDVPRDQVEICTKVFFPTADGANNRGLSRKHVREAVHASMRRLQLDYLDVLYAHRYDPETPLEETLRAFDDLIRHGDVLYIGVSEWRVDWIRDAVRMADEMNFDRIVASQPQFNLLWRVIEDEIAPVCRQEGIGQVVFSPLAQGVLTGKYRPGATLPVGSRAASEGGMEMVRRLLQPAILDAVSKFSALCEEAGHHPATVALSWVLQTDNVASAVIGASRPEQIRQNAAALDLRLDPDLIRAIEGLFEPVAVRDPSLVHVFERRP